MAVLDAAEPEKPEDPNFSFFTKKASLINVLRDRAVRLVRPQYLIGLHKVGGRIGKRQELPEEAFCVLDELTPDQLEQVEIIAFSYCWLSVDHPDPEGYHLATIAKVLECSLRGSFNTANKKGYERKGNILGSFTESDKLREAGYDFGAGDGRPVGVFLDWASLFQDKPKGSRTNEQTALFKQALKTINIWYAHQGTKTVMLTSTPDGTMRASYIDSGWTTFERIVGGIISKETDLLMIDGKVREILLAPVPKREPDVYTDFQGLPMFNKDLPEDDPRWNAWRTYRYMAAGDFLQLTLDTMDKDRGPPVTPSQFNIKIQPKHFTNGADLNEIVIPKYRETFDAVITHATVLSLKNIGFGTVEGQELIKVVRESCQELKELDLSNNPQMGVTLEDMAGLAEAVGLQKLIMEWCTALVGDVGCLGAAPTLTTVNLRMNGDFEGMGHEGLGGEVGPLAALVNLSYLNLSGSGQVCGDISSFEGLVHLGFLDLSRTRVSGDIARLAALVSLKVLRLNSERFTGDVAHLAAMVNLEELDLNGAEVVGDIASLAALVRLGTLNLSCTQVTGDVAPLAALVNLKAFSVQNSKVTGDGAALKKALPTLSTFYWLDGTDLAASPTRCCAIS